MIYRMLADLVVILHLLFIIFALLGGSLVLWRGYMLLVHVPAALWVAVISFKGWICPLTPLENQLRQAAGGEGYPGGFVEHYIIPVIYPVGLRFDVQFLLGMVAIGINIVIYALVYYWCKLRHDRWRE
ncbi:DUF2784 domain-containing protein [Photobacterium gaetbulicola]|uniref:DUF2784 domain-containing protein n=1 Tax=Photobacterium gaetbulicola Gung47 TaxID=658445 RepID=A0A0C5WGE7_9GAMM|nr:DUF2784 domain-containing protein [Photobacterium gaetbulicola]AJR05257.1 hypothetical protein H744_1c0231 [Photobacterium gaetbulicola Gung47]PSU06088.1 DUF2784 domain-containing protein [Photobacterium gaetbulicola]